MPSSRAAALSDFRAALDRAFEWGEKIPTGLFYRAGRPIYDDSEPVLQKGPLVDQPLGLSRELFGRLLEETM